MRPRDYMERATERVMTPQEFEQRMWRIAQSGDLVDRKVAADRLVREVLDALGYATGVEVYRSMDKWKP